MISLFRYRSYSITNLCYPPEGLIARIHSSHGALNDVSSMLSILSPLCKVQCQAEDRDHKRDKPKPVGCREFVHYRIS